MSLSICRTGNPLQSQGDGSLDSCAALGHVMTLSPSCVIFLTLLEAKPQDDIAAWYRMNKQGFYLAD